MDLENKAPEEEKDKKPVEETEKPVTETEQPVPDDKQADENGEGAAAQPEQAEQEAPAEEKAPEAEPEAAPAADPSAELETLREENTRLKAQLEAHKAGFRGEYIEDAVLIAEHAAKRDGTTIEEALQAVAKKYPEWNHTADSKGKSGFKVGAETPKEDNTAVNDQLDEAFGIRKKK